MSILIVGGNGNMGKRYRAVLHYLEQEWMSADVNTPPTELARMARHASGIMIATPTDTHADLITTFSRMRKPILCEKPISKNPSEVRSILDYVQAHRCPFSMVYQYRMLLKDPTARGASFYDYFKHGSDGLAWDCIQVIGLANGRVLLAERSPLWKCSINGQDLNIGQMDMAYIQFIAHWMREPHQDLGALGELHEKTAEIDRDYRKTHEQNH